MSRNSIKAVDLFCRVLNWNNSLENAYDDEVERWTMKRDRELMKLRNVMGKVTLEEFSAGRWGNTPMQKRVEQWDEMKALCEGAK
jgi:hypothetical protein